MSKKSIFFITIIILCCAVATGNRIMRYYEEKKPAKKRARIEVAEPVRYPHDPAPLSLPEDYYKTELFDLHEETGNTRVLFNLQAMDEQELEAAAKEIEPLAARAQALINKYKNEPVIKAFNQDLAAAGLNGVSFTSLNTGNFAKALEENPEIQNVVMKYVQNEDFLKALQKLAEDPELRELNQKINELSK